MIKKNIINRFTSFLSNISRKSSTLLFQSSGLKFDQASWNKIDFLKAEQINLYTNRAIGKRGEKVGEIKFTLTKNGKPVENSKLLDLLNKPNPIQTGTEFWCLYQKYKDVTGDVYIWLVPKPSLTRATGIERMQLLRPDMVTYKVNEDTGDVEFIKFNKRGGETLILPKEQVVHSHHYGLIDNTHGESLLLAGARAVFTESQLFDYQANILKNGGSIDGVFKVKTERLSKVQLQEMKDQYIEQLSQARKAGSPLFLGGDADYQKMALTPAELSYLESKKVTLEDISIMTGVPKTILGSYDGVKFDNAVASQKIFLMETIVPLLNNLTTVLNEDDVLTEDGEELGYISPIPEDTERKLKLNENGVKNFYMTTNEARANVDLEPIQGGDTILKPFGLMPEEAKPNPKPKDKKECCPKYKVKKDFVHPLRDSKIRVAYGLMKVAKEDNNIKFFEKALKIYFKSQRDRILEPLKAQETASFIKADAGDVFNIDLEAKIAFENFLPLLTEFLKEAGADTFDLVESTFAFTLTSEIGSWLDKKVNIFTRTINETTFERLKNEFKVSAEKQETRRQLIRRIENTYEDGGEVITRARATTIARTEVAGVMGKGTFEGYKQSGVPIKIWVTVGDNNVRASHAMQDGEEKPINTPFSNGLQYPRDPSGSAEEVINCRCQV